MLDRTLCTSLVSLYIKLVNVNTKADKTLLWQRGNAQILIFWKLLPLLVKIDAPTLEINMANHSQEILKKKQCQRQLAVPPQIQTFLQNAYIETFQIICKKKHIRQKIISVENTFSC